MCENQGSKIINKLVDQYKDYIKNKVMPNIPLPSAEIVANHQDSLKFFSDAFRKEAIGDNVEAQVAALIKELDVLHKDVLIKNNKFSDEKNKSLLEKFRQKIKGMLVKGDIKSVEELNNILDKAHQDYNKDIPDNDTKEQVFSDWREKLQNQLAAKLHEDEKKKLEQTKNLMSNQLDSIQDKLKQKEVELHTTRKD